MRMGLFQVEMNESEKGNGSPLLEMKDGRLVLMSGGMEMYGDFTHMIPRIRKDRLGREMLVRAAKIHADAPGRPVIFDATAGLGEDSLLLAAAGGEVYMAERDEIIYALLADALKRAADEPTLGDIVGHMHLTRGDSIRLMRGADRKIRPEIIYLDPMFPERKKSGLVKKKMQLLKMLEMPCEDEKALLEAALAAAPRKIIIKRPVNAPFLGARKPSYSIAGKVIRYDCIVQTEPVR